MVERIMATKIGQQELKPLDKQFDEEKGYADDLARRSPGDPGGGRGTQANFNEIDPRDKPVSINEPPWAHQEPQEDPHNPKPREYVAENPKFEENKRSREEQLEDEQRRAERAEKQSAEGFNQGFANQQPDEAASKRKKEQDDEKQKERDRKQEEERKRKAKQEEEEEDAKEPNKRRR